jgi:hypothetical protein
MPQIRVESIAARQHSLTRALCRTAGLLPLLAGLSAGVSASGCQGAVADPHGLVPGKEPATGGSDDDDDRGGGPSAAASDEVMRAENPTLFESALSYFPGEAFEAGPKRLARLTRTQLDLTTKALLPSHYESTATSSLPKDPLQTNYEYADNLNFNAANFTPYTRWVEELAARVRLKPAPVIDCSSSSNAPSCLDEQARKFVARAFRGVVSEPLLERFSAFYLASVKEADVPTATGDLVDVTLTSPYYVFRDEVRTQAGSLSPAQQLQNISYTLADAPPEALGLTTASSKEPLQRTIDRVLATPEARDKLMRFFTAWLEVREPEEFTIASDVFPEFTPALAAAMVEETRAFLKHQLGTAAPKLKDVTQSTQSFVSSSLASIYRVKAPAGSGLVELDSAQRLGIFTQPAVIASHSGPTTTRLVKRGVFFTRKVMCLPLGLPPAGANTTIPVTKNTTERQRIEQGTQSAACKGCHTYINPFGFMQENYDAIGRWRTTDEGQPVNASINIEFLDEGTLSTASPVDALKAITSSLRFQQCFARQLFRFYMGRDEQEGDDPTLRQMFFGFANDGEQNIVSMLQTLAGSASFSQRSEKP